MKLFDSASFRDLVSGRRRGAGASLLRGALRLGETCYATAVQLRNWGYDLGAVAVRRADAPVVSVGNLTLGGTGKTPMVRWLARWFLQRGVRVSVVSRGYGSAAGEANDEALEMRLLLPDVPHLQNPDRVSAAREAVEKHGSQLVVLDDGFQHRRIARDLEIVLLDALTPFGYGHVFPRGMLREPVSGLRRADAVVLSRADLIEPSGREAIWRIVRRHAPDAVCAEATHAPQALISAGAGKGVRNLLCEAPEGPFRQKVPDTFSGTESIGGKPVAAFCGLGNPAGFRHTLEQCGCRVVGFREFPDHHRYTPEDEDSLSRWAEELDVSAVLCTCKDLMKISRDRLGTKPLWAVRIELELLVGQEALESRLRRLCNV